jgi:hypothetical protein
MATLIPKYDQGGTGAVNRPINLKLAESVSVLDFGADPTGVADSTAAFNLATNAAHAGTGLFDQDFPGGVFVPAGVYKLSGTVYVHKGQHLYGVGAGASKIDASGMTGASVPVFKMGFSASGEDVGGLAPEISEIWCYGGPVSYPVIEATVAGAFIHDVFMTSPGIGIRITGGDILVSNVIIDQAQKGIELAGQNNCISDVLFYNMNYGIYISSNTFDCQINNCHFEYQEFTDIIFDTAATNIQNVTIQGCQFVTNEQYSTKVATIDIRSAGSSITIQGCQFRNGKGFAIAKTTGIGGNITVYNCVFNGLKTNPAYAQSTTAAGIDISFANFNISNCQFVNLLDYPIFTNGTISYSSTITNCTYSNNSAAYFATVSATVGGLTINGCQGDGVTPLINLQSSMGVALNNNLFWLGAAQTASSRYYWNIPTQDGELVQISIVANTNVGGNPEYRSTGTYIASRNINFSGTNITDYAALTTVYAYAGTAYAGALAPQLDLSTVGGGASATFTTVGKYLVISVPNTYDFVEIKVDYLT